PVPLERGGCLYYNSTRLHKQICEGSLRAGVRPADRFLNVADALISIMTSAPGSTGNGGDVL
ncbi:MAG TPA: hypothetical protein DCQ79_10095, partial [Rhizobiales bacterium]|nr:hypothetical protein [Hyphomicrobiales bacterium]